MRCPGCGEDSLSGKDRLRVALRAQTRCPACGIAIHFGFWPRLVHSLFGDAALLTGAAGAFFWEAPFLLPLAASSWVSLALLLPIEPDRSAPNTRHKH